MASVVGVQLIFFIQLYLGTHFLFISTKNEISPGLCDLIAGYGHAVNTLL